MKRTLLLAMAVVLALVFTARDGLSEMGYVSLSATETSQTYTFTRPVEAAQICNFGTNNANFRAFNENETSAAATTSSALLVAGTSTAPVCFNISKTTTQPAYFRAVSVVCAAAETATVRIYFN